MTSLTATIPARTKFSRKSNRSSLLTIQKQQEENVAILANTNKEDSPIYLEINNVMIEIEKFRDKLRELSRIQQQQRYGSPDDSDDDDVIHNKNNEEKLLEINEKMMQAVQNQLAVVRQHIGNILDNCEMLDENLLTVIMTYNEEVNIALQEAFEEVPSPYNSCNYHPHNYYNNSINFSNGGNNTNFFNSPEGSTFLYHNHHHHHYYHSNERNNSQQIIEAQAIQIYFLEKANFNNIFQLISDIEQCQELLHDYTKLRGVIKGENGCCKEFDVEIKLDGVRELLIQYECRTKINEDEEFQHQDWLKQFVGGVLQRLIIETVLEHSDIYFNGSFNDPEMKTKRESFLGLTKFTDLSKPLSNVNPEVYSVLGSKGYDGFDHPFIEFVAEKIVAIMNQYCVIESSEKMNQIQKLSSEVVHSLINIFYFRMQAQDQPSQFRWIENGKDIEKETMKGPWDANYDDLIVDICCFPLIGRRLINDDLLKVYSKAEIFPYRRPENLGIPINVPGSWPTLKYY